MEILPGWQDPSYHAYLRLVIAILMVIGTVLLILKLFTKTNVIANNIWKTYVPWYVMLPIIFFAVGSTHLVFVSALFLLSIACTREFTKATGLHQNWPFMLVIYVIISVTYYFAYTLNYDDFLTIPLYAIASLIILPIFLRHYQHMLQRVAISCICVLYLSWFPAHLSFFGDDPSRFGFLLFLIIGTELNDAAASLFGKALGKHQLIPDISPNKTIEGALGSLLFTTAYVFAMSAYFPHFSIAVATLSILIIWAGGTLGDLVISYIKRDIGIKDMGKLIPGHGGILDRADSLILISPIYFNVIANYYRI